MLVSLQVNMRFLRSYFCDLWPALTIRCSIVLYLVNSIGCKPQVTQELLRNGSYYMNGKIVCLKCPAGYFVRKDCVISYTQGLCQMCNPGVNYSEHETGLNSCLTCTKCRADQEEISPCNITKNTVCQCKNGTYCPTNSTSNQCLPCRSSCPKEQVLQQTCNSTSDIVCVPIIPNPTVYMVVSFGIPVTIVLIIAIGAWFFCRRSGDGLKWIPKIFTKHVKHYETTEANAQEQFLPQEYKLYMTIDIREEEVISRTFCIFVDLVPSHIFEKFVLELGLRNSDIDLIKQDSSATEEKHYAMLSLLSQKQGFHVNIWLSKLDFIKLGKVAQEISTRLIEEELFERSI
ncbi:tumor necrosis factor receptor superfamily member 10B-like [Phyllobates terribilis]|uniref:tumor necrosis factor receptor superfamily member 10B-like n=1 Tax=Phyllobates terribilis TaxID=111132 RepID=UPI003CCB2030